MPQLNSINVTYKMMFLLTNCSWVLKALRFTINLLDIVLKNKSFMIY